VLKLCLVKNEKHLLVKIAFYDGGDFRLGSSGNLHLLGEPVLGGALAFSKRISTSCFLFLSLYHEFSFFHALASRAAFSLLLLQQFVELLLTSGEEELSEVHFGVFAVVEFLEKGAAQTHVLIKIHSLAS